MRLALKVFRDQRLLRTGFFGKIMGVVFVVEKRIF